MTRIAAGLGVVALALVALATPGCTLITKGTIAGTIYEAGTVPHTVLPGALVTATSDGSEVASMTTVADGKYKLSDLSPGTYAVTVELTGYASRTIEVKVDFGDNLAANIRRDIPLSKVRGTISGIVRGQVGPAQFPLSGATVNLTGAATATTQTTSDGEYAFPNLDDGAYQVTASLAGFQTSAPRNVTIIGGVSQTDIDFILPDE